ncbi:FixH family protein [Bacillus sp. SA1-12]|uniref:FixH family protein n=1 Tax=Bacillus sp. SA1-12 TaxID=1455638 RepID=UPI0018CCA9EF|nr:FixH family protein [Bacillus sp. SA1-12]
MKNVIFIITCMICVLIISGCQESETHGAHQQTADEEVKAPKVEIQVKEHVNKNETTPITATVYYGEDLVDDAKVTFEIKLGDESEKVDAKLADTGTYTAEYLFKEDGAYQVIAHTDVKDYHTMPVKEIQVGEGTSLKSTEDEHQNHQETEADHHHDDVTIQLEELTNVKAKENIPLQTTVNMEDQAFTKATVRFEIWKEGEEKHHYIDAEETATKGMYTSSYQFEAAGSYHIVIHVEKGEIHSHKEALIEVK